MLPSLSGKTELGVAEICKTPVLCYSDRNTYIRGMRFLLLLLVFLLPVCLEVRAQQDAPRQLQLRADTGGIRKALRALGNTYHLNPQQAADTATALLRTSIRNGLRSETITAGIFLSRIHTQQGAYDTALAFLQTAWYYCDTPGNARYLPHIFNEIANIYQYQSRHALAARFYHMSVGAAKTYVPEYLETGMVYGNYGALFARLKQYGKSEYYLQKALTSPKIGKHIRYLTTVHLSLGNVYFEARRYPAAEAHMDTALLLARQHGNMEAQHNALANLAAVRQMQDKPEEAIHLLREALNIATEHRLNPSLRITTMGNLGAHYLTAGHYTEAEKYLTEAASADNMLPLNRLQLLEKLHTLYRRTNRHAQAYDRLQDYYRLKDSMQQEQTLLEVTALEAKYASAEKDRQLMAQQNHILRMRSSMALVIAACLLAIGGIISVVVYRQRKQKTRTELDRLQAMIEGEEKERNRLARELHDGVNSRLAAISIRLESFKHRPETSVFTHDFEEIRSLLHHASADIRTVAHNLAPEELIRNGLSHSIKDFCLALFRDEKITMLVEVYPHADTIPEKLALSVYRIVQELAHNIIRHAQAGNVTILVIRTEAQLELIVEDDGIGIPLSPGGDMPAASGLGLGSVRERVLAHRGQLTITRGNNDRGTMVHITFPLAD